MSTETTRRQRWQKSTLKFLVRWWGLLASLLFTLLLASEELRRSSPVYTSQTMERLDYLYYDTRLRLMPFPELIDEPDIVILDIDEKSLAERGQWPWSRGVLTEMNHRLMDAGVFTITYDVVFSEPERNIALEVSELLQDEDPLVSSLVASFRDEVDYDHMFAESLRDAGAVMGFSLYPDDRVRVGQLPEPLAPVYNPDTPRDQQAPMNTIQGGGYVANLPAIQEAADAGGLINPVPDLDGIIRRVALLQEYDGQLYTSLALATVYNYFLYHPDEINYHVSDEGGRRLFRSVDVAAEGGPNRILTDSFSRVMVPYAGEQGTFPYISATDVIADRLTDEERDLLEGAIVLVGTSSIGLLDLRATPLDNAYPGVEIHANLVNGLLTGQVGHELHNTHVYTAMLMVVLGLLYCFWFRRFGPMPLLATTLVCVGVLVALNYFLWRELNANMPIAAVLLLVLALGAFNMLEGFLRERSSRKEVHSMFGQYVPKEHIERMLESSGDFGFEGERKEITVLFSDIRSFTNISESLSAGELKDLLNRYFTPITRIIFERNGTIDKYVGDMVMAFWGAPLDDPRHAQNAVVAAMDQIAMVEKLKPEFRADGLPEINVGIGLNTGMMNVGDMGSSYRRSYTVLGDSVNLGARLESLTKFYGADVLVGPQTYEQCSGYVFRFIDLIIVKGKSEPIKCYEPLCREDKSTSELEEELAIYEKAWSLYRDKQWQAASDAFQDLMQRATDKRAKLYSVYLERIADLEGQTLPEDWDGAYRHTSK